MIVYNKYDEPDMTPQAKKKFQKNFDKSVKEYIKRFYKDNDAPLFKAVEIETINKCNMTCAFCPANKLVDTRPRMLMSVELFESIINQLAEMGYRGKVALFSNNEPFLDGRIVAFARYAKEKLPDAFIHLYTNGTLITVEKFKQIISYLDRMIIDNYNDELVMNRTTKEIFDLCEKMPEYGDKVQIHYRKINEVLYTRGGQSPNNTKKKHLHVHCPLPYKQLVVRPDGKVSLCCNDVYGTYTMGDLSKQQIMDVWCSKEYLEIRKKMKRGRWWVPICRYCDTLHPGE